MQTNKIFNLQINKPSINHLHPIQFMENPNPNYSKIPSMADNLKMHAGASYITKNNPARPRGEDAYFIDEAAQVIGVADGVGSWAKKGIDSGKYARKLMKKAAKAVKGYRPADVNPKSVLIKAYLSTAEEGSSTACIICVNGCFLQAANLGDSGFLVVRNGKSVYKSRSQQHRFNCPYQMSRAEGNDKPDAAEEVVVAALEEGDVIVVGTDGLWDNLFVEDIVKVVEFCVASEDTPEMMSWTVAKVAHQKSLKKEGVSPFQMAASEAGLSRSGGKADDITVVVAYVGDVQRRAHN